MRENAIVGEDCVIGRGVYIENDVVVGNRVKIQANALIYKPAQLGDEVFIGPGVILTNDQYPRACTPDGQVKRDDDWQAEGVTISKGASIGARAVVLPGIRIGAFALVAAGSIVTADVGDFAIVAGGPARRIGWAGPAGVPLTDIAGGEWICPATKEVFVEMDGQLCPAGRVL